MTEPTYDRISELQPVESARRADATDPAAASTADRAAGLDCLRCGGRITPLGLEELRTGGSTGATQFFFGGWAEMGENKLPVEVYVCPACRHLELRAPQ